MAVGNDVQAVGFPQVRCRSIVYWCQTSARLIQKASPGKVPAIVSTFEKASEVADTCVKWNSLMRLFRQLVSFVASPITAAITQVAANKLKIKIDAKCDLGSSH